MPTETYPVRLILDLTPDEHARWLDLARTARMTLEQWVAANVRAVVAEIDRRSAL